MNQMKSAVDGTVTSGTQQIRIQVETGTIVDNDATPSITIANVTVNEGDGMLTVQVTLRA
jgi:hypothetical protein